MSSVGVPDFLSGLRLARAQRDVKLRLETAQIELVTGERQDRIAATNGDPLRLFALDAEITRIESRLPLLELAEARADGAVTALETVRDSIGEYGVDLLAAAVRGDAHAARTFADDARALLGQMISALNVNVGGRFVFGGDAADRAPLGNHVGGLEPMEELLAGVRLALSGDLTEADGVTPLRVDDGGGPRAATVEERIAAFFDTPYGEARLGDPTASPPEGTFTLPNGIARSVSTEGTAAGGAFYRGGAVDAPAVELSKDARLSYGVNADAAEIRRVVMTLSVVIVAGEFGGDGTFSDAEMLGQIENAATDLLGAKEGLTQLQSRLGLDQRRIEDAIARNQAEKAGFEKARAGLIGRDQYEAATLVTELETQLQSIYAMTARTARLSLLNFL